MKQLIFPTFILLVSSILLVLIIPDLSTATAEVEPAKLINGVVTDHQTGEKLPGVKVFCENTKAEAYTDFNGMFSLPTNGVANSKLRFEYISYQSTHVEGDFMGKEPLQIALKQ